MDKKRVDLLDKKRIDLLDKKRIDLLDKKRVDLLDKKRIDLLDKKRIELMDKNKTALIDKKRKPNFTGRIVLIVLIIIIATAAVYFSIFYEKKCYNEECFNYQLKNCYKANYVKDAEEAVWQYSIKGITKIDNERECKVKVNLLEVKKGDAEIKNMEGKSMLCYIIEGIVVEPEGDLEKCHGLLKEEMQAYLIKKAHEYILKNLGQISEELKRAL